MITRIPALTFAICSIAGTVPISAFAAPAVSVAQSPNASVTYSVSEWELAVDKTYANPYDPAQVAIDAEFTGPGGLRADVPAFWYQPVDQDIRHPGAKDAKLVGGGKWVVRFAPMAPGKWTLAATIVDPSGTVKSKPVQFDAKAPTTDGFVHTSRQNHRYFQFDSGRSLFLVGLNLAYTRAWDNSGNKGDEANYPNWFDKLSQNGGNFARIWTTHLVTPNSSLNRYDPIEGDRLDRVLRTAQADGVYCMLTLDNFRQFYEKDDWGPALWHVNPYNAANGGPIASGQEFFTNAQAQDLYKQRLRYMVARYSAFSSLAFWELLNEGDNLHYAIKCDIPLAWYTGMSKTLTDTDPYHRLVSTSYGSPPGVDATPAWNSPSIGLSQSHIYGDGDRIRDCVSSIVGESDSHARYDKPFLVSEMGLSWRGPDQSYNSSLKPTNVHNGLWSAALSGAAGGACYWYWDTYIDKYDLWPSYKGLGAFASSIDWANRQFAPLTLPDQPNATTTRPLEDVVLSGEQPWGKANGTPVAVDKVAVVTGALPQYLFGPQKPEMQGPTTLNLDLVAAGKMRVDVSRISGNATIRVVVDGAPFGDFAFSARPGSPGIVNTTFQEKWKVYQADVKDGIDIDLKPGKHAVTIENVDGDWAKVDAVTISGASFETQGIPHRVLALGDSKSGEIAAWVQDVASNWKNDVAGKAPAAIDSLPVLLPLLQPGAYNVDWWDTTTGKIVRSDKVKSSGKSLRLDTPRFEGDIALHIVRSRQPE